MTNDSLKKLAEFEYYSDFDYSYTKQLEPVDMTEIIRSVKDLLKSKLNRFEDSIQYAIEAKFEDDSRKNKIFDKKINELNNNLARIEKMVVSLQETITTQHI